MTEKVDGNGASSTFEYDNLGRVTKEINPDGSFKTNVYRFDSTENSVITTNESGTALKYLYDDMGNLVSEIDVATGSVHL